MIKEYYRHGGSETPQYFCRYCFKTHTKNSLIGKKHIKYIAK
jgi:hypothetical protein